MSWRQVNEAAASDEECMSLSMVIADGFPENRADLPEPLRKFWYMRDELYVIGNVPYKGNKMLIPKSLRPLVLEGLHAGHQGVSSMLSNARSRYFWPGLDAAVTQLRKQCSKCNEQSPSQPAEPLIYSKSPEVPFEQVVADFFSLEGHSFLAYADRYSGWLEVERLSSSTFRNVRSTLLRWFRTYGVPEEISTDGGPPFQAHEYNIFLRSWNIDRRLSSAYYPQSNGRAEAAVKSAKRILSGNIDPITGTLDTNAATKAIMAHRNTPTQDTGIAPSVMLFGRLIRDHLPQSSKKLRPEWQTIADAREMALAKRALKALPSESKELQPLEIGDCVQIQNQTGNHPNKWLSTGVVSEVLPHRQYNIVVDGSRRITLRNRRFLRKILPVTRKNDFAPDFDVPDIPLVRETIQPSEPEDVAEPTMQHDRNIVVPPSVSPNGNTSNEVPIPPVTTEMPAVPLRRSTRPRVERKLFSARMHGKTHDDP